MVFNDINLSLYLISIIYLKNHSYFHKRILCYFSHNHCFPFLRKRILFYVGNEEKIIPIVISYKQSMVCELLKTKINQLPNTTVAFFALFYVFLLSKSLTQSDYKCNVYNINKNCDKEKI